MRRTLLGYTKETRIRHSGRIDDQPKEAAMVTVAVLYPRTDDVQFDMDYYREKHFGLLREALGDKLKRDEIHQVLDGPYVAFCLMYFDSIEDYQSGMAERGAEIRGDVANYTNARPVVLVSNVEE